MYIESDVYDDNNNFIYRRIITQPGQSFHFTGLTELTNYTVRSRRNEGGLFSAYSYSDFTTSAGIILEERIIYNSNKSGQWQSYSIKPDGTDEINITAIGDNNPSAHEDHYCTYNLNEDAYIFCRVIAGYLQIHKKDRVSGIVTQLTSSANNHIFPSANSDGSKIVCNAAGSVKVIDGSTGIQLYLWTPTFLMDIINYPTFNNNDDILLSCVSFPSYTIDLYTISGSLISNIGTDFGGTQVRYNSDFSKILYRNVYLGIDQVYEMNANGTGKTRITNGIGDKEFVTYSPDELSFAFIQPAYTGNVYISTFVDPETKTNITNNSSNNEFNGFWGNVRVD